MIIIKYYYYDQYFAIPQEGNFYTKGELIDRYVIQSESYPLNSYYLGYWWIRDSFAYEEKYYLVTFKDWDGTIIDSSYVLSGLHAIAPPNPDRYGHLFTGWSGNYTSVTSDRTITAVYESQTISYEIMFLHESTLLYYTDVEHFGSVDAPATPNVPGYTFSHWDGGDPSNWSGNTYHNVTSAIDFYTVYTKNSVYFSVTYRGMNNAYISSQSVLSGQNGSPPTPPNVTGYTFSHWEGNYTNVTSDRTIYARYTIITYRVYFYNWDNTFLGYWVTDHGSSATLPATPTRPGYTFSHWDGDYTNVTSNRNIYAVFTKDPIYYSVTYINIQGYNIVTRTIEEGHDDVPPTPPLVEGHDFSHWEGSYTNVTSNRAIYARYILKVYTVTFYDWDWTYLKREWISHGSSATAPPNPSRVDHNFSGWSDSYTEVTSDMNIVAYYTFIERTLVYQKVNGVWVAADKTYMKVNNVWKEIADILLKKGAYWISSKNS